MKKYITIALYVYVIFSILVLLTIELKPAFDHFCGWLVFLTGPISGLSLGWECIVNTLIRDSAISIEAIAVGMVALFIWFCGLAILRKKTTNLFFKSLLMTLLWLIGAFYNTFWFGIRGL